MQLLTRTSDKGGPTEPAELLIIYPVIQVGVDALYSTEPKAIQGKIAALAPDGRHVISGANAITLYMPLENYRTMINPTLRNGEYL
jgi:hypothetical protein